MISLFVSLTLSPAMAAILLKPHDDGAGAKRGLLYWLSSPIRWFFMGFNWAFGGLSNAFGALTARLVRMGVVVLLLFGLLLVPTYDQPHPAARSHLFHCSLPAAARIDAQQSRRDRARDDGCLIVTPRR